LRDKQSALPDKYHYGQYWESKNARNPTKYSY
jgi:hypothetical protein